MTNSPSVPPNPLADLLVAVKAESEQLRADVHRAEAARRRANRINTFLLLVAVLLVAVVGVVGWQVKATNDRIADCTTVGGTCYEEGRARTGAAIATLTRISIYVSQCGRLYPGESGPQYDTKIEKCVAERLTQAQASPSPSAPSSLSPSATR
jgi:hypothetical protein